MSAVLVAPPPQKRARRFTKLLVRRKRASLSRSDVCKVGSTQDSDISSISSDASSSSTEVLQVAGFLLEQGLGVPFSGFGVTPQQHIARPTVE